MIVYFGILSVLYGTGWSLADSDSLWSSSNEGNKFSGSGPKHLLLNTNEESSLALSLNDPSILPLDSLALSSSSLDEPNLNLNSISLFGNSEATNPDLFLSDNNSNSGSSGLIGDGNQPFELADCSSSSSIFSPINGKFRKAKRIDGSPRSCGTSESPPGSGDITFPPALMQEKFEILRSLENSYSNDASREELKHNGACIDLTLGVLPWGACSNPDPKYTYEAKLLEPYPWLGGLKMWYLDYCTALPDGFTTCLFPGQDFYCCEFFDHIPNEVFGDFGEYCVLFSLLQQRPRRH